MLWGMLKPGAWGDEEELSEAAEKEEPMGQEGHSGPK